MTAGQSDLRVKFDEAQLAWGVTGPDGQWVDQVRKELKHDAEEHRDWHARAAAR